MVDGAMEVGASIVGAGRELVARIGGLFADPVATPAEYTALRTPVDSAERLAGDASADLAVRIPRIVLGWPDPAERDEPDLPFVAVRPGSAKLTEAGRSADMLVAIATRCPAPKDFEYAWTIVERIWRDLAGWPYLGIRDQGIGTSFGGAAYRIDDEGIDWQQSGDLMQAWNAYVLVGTVPVLLRPFAQVYGPDGALLDSSGITWGSE